MTLLVDVCIGIIGSTREWTCCILDSVHILNSTVVHTPGTFGCIYFVLMVAEQIIGYRHYVLVDTKRITGQTDGYHGQT